MSEDMVDVNPTIAVVTADFHDKILAKVHSNLLQASEDGALTTSMALDTLASFIISSWQGAMLRMKTSNQRQVLEDFYSILEDVLLK